MDEPTSGLDPLIQREFFAILHERNEAGTTIFLSSHVLSEVQRNCRKAAIVREGRLVACGGVEELARTNAKRITIHGEVNLDGLPGIRDRQAADGGVSFLYSGDLNHLVRRIVSGHIIDLSVTEPDLEEIFLHYLCLPDCHQRPGQRGKGPDCGISADPPDQPNPGGRRKADQHTSSDL